MTVYKITNKSNGDIYIGQTRKTVEARWKQHCEAGKNSYISKAIKKYGKDNFSLASLGTYDDINIDDAETYFIDFYNTLAPNGYNLTTGGRANKRLSAESRLRLSISRRGQRNSPNTEFKPGPRPETRGAGNTMYGKPTAWRKPVVICETNQIFACIAHLAVFLNTSRSYVSRLLSGKGRGKRVKGFTIKYLKDANV